MESRIERLDMKLTVPVPKRVERSMEEALLLVLAVMVSHPESARLAASSLDVTLERLKESPLDPVASRSLSEERKRNWAQWATGGGKKKTMDAVHQQGTFVLAQRDFGGQEEQQQVWTAKE